MGWKRLDSIRDYHQNKFDVVIECLSCRHKVIYTAADLCAHLGYSYRDSHPENVAKRMRCTECGRKNATVRPIDWCLSRG